MKVKKLGTENPEEPLKKQPLKLPIVRPERRQFIKSFHRFYHCYIANCFYLNDRRIVKEQQAVWKVLNEKVVDRIAGLLVNVSYLQATVAFHSLRRSNNEHR